MTVMKPLSALMAIIAMAFAGLSGCSTDVTAQTPAQTGDSASFSRPVTAAFTSAQALPDFAGLVERFGPAVVNVSTLQKQRQISDIPEDLQEPFSEFFRRFGVPQMPRGNPGPAQGEGSGFIISPDGYIL